MIQSSLIQYFWLPIFLGLVGLLSSHRSIVQRTTVIFILSSAAYMILMYLGFDSMQGGYQFYIKKPWIVPHDIYYELGVDGFSLPLIYLSIFCSWLIILWQYAFEDESRADFIPWILILTGLLIGFFSAIDLVLFYFFFEAMLIPMYLLILNYGSSEREYAAKKFFLYTFFGSIFLFLALCLISLSQPEGSQYTSFSMLSLPHAQFSSSTSLVLSFLMIFSMGVKIPMWPIHSWLFHAHVQAPTSGSVLLAAVLLKVGGYGLIRLLMPLDHLTLLLVTPYLLYLGVFAIVYIGFVAFVQQDMKRLIAYSSIAHMGFVTVGIAIAILLKSSHQQYASMALSGAYFQMISHGLISAGLFFSVGVLYKRVHSRQIKDYGGVAQSMPKFCGFFVFFAMANCGLPGTSGFIGEALVIFSTFAYSPVIALIIGMSLILSAVFSLYLVKKVFFGPVRHESVKNCQDIDNVETGLFSVLALGVLVMGIYPHSILLYLV